jgi:hypothetical protein
MRLYERSPVFWRKREPEMLDVVLNNAISVMLSHEKDSEEYARQVDRVIKLLELRVQHSAKSSVSKDTLATVGANLLGIIMIIKHESVNVITSKALSFVIKPRI